MGLGSYKPLSDYFSLDDPTDSCSNDQQLACIFRVQYRSGCVLIKGNISDKQSFYISQDINSDNLLTYTCIPSNSDDPSLCVFQVIFKILK